MVVVMHWLKWKVRPKFKGIITSRVDIVGDLIANYGLRIQYTWSHAQLNNFFEKNTTINERVDNEHINMVH